MTDLRQPTDPSPGWQLDHLREYVETEGERGHLWMGVPTLLLTTTGRRSGQARRTPLIYGEDADGRYVLVASKGGSPDHPAWYYNLDADPRVLVQIKGDVFEAVAHTAQGDERAALWQLMTKIWPAYDEYQTKTDRQIPVVVLTRVS
ncbi:nitroreductase family deazaflavin-dependent oxidoreductase [Luedemannella helvata]|uniref:Nitroreductase family deazaflavin-dependent oxidoreductase n=1 Tax=Luedemannella helvata TaxID=349315 RepID=A0ABP4WVY3_9ACTN